MNDRELLELAAKAAGIEIATWSNAQAGGFQTQESAKGKFWNPLNDDGDALRLAVKLNIEIHLDLAVGSVFTAFCIGRYGYNTSEEVSENRGNPYLATRRAIVRAAAEIGKSMQEQH